MKNAEIIDIFALNVSMFIHGLGTTIYGVYLIDATVYTLIHSLNCLI